MRLLTEVPPLPANFTSRQGLNGAMLAAVRRAAETSGLCCVHGEGGMGKTVATCAFVSGEEGLGELFPEGAAFATVGQTPHVLSLQASLLRALGAGGPLLDTADGYARLLGALAGRRCLVVLDDVWEQAHLEMFAPLHARPKAWGGVVVLCTTRFQGLAPAHSGAELLRLGELTNVEVSSLLGVPESNQAMISQLAQLCARSPLALSILGASKRLDLGAVEWPSVCKELSAEEKTEKNAVKRCIGLAARRLSARARDLYLRLAVFPDDTLLPLAALETILSADSVVAMPDLRDRHLLSVESGSGGTDRVRLHDLSLEFVKERAAKELPGGEAALHAELLTRYGATLGKGGCWWTGPNDGYFFEGLLYHLSKAGRGAEGRELLLRWDWLWARLRHTKDVVALIADVRALAPAGALEQPPRTDSPQPSEGAAASSASGLPPKAGARASVAGATGAAGPAGGGAKAARSLRATKAAAPAAKAKPKAKAAPSAPSRAPAAAPRPPASGRASPCAEDGEAKTWGALLEVLSLSAHVLTEDARQLPFQVSGRLAGYADAPGGPMAAVRDGANAALLAGSFALRRGDLFAGVRPVSCGALQGVGGPLQRTLQLHRDWVRSIAVSGDGGLLVSGSSDLTVKVWDLNNDCRLIYDFAEQHESAIFTVDISQRQLAASGDKDVAIIWGLEAGSMLRKIPGFEGALAALKFVGSSHLAVAVDQSVRFFATTGGEEVGACRHEDKVAGLGVSSAHGTEAFLLACACGDNHVVLWRLSLKKSRGGAPATVEAQRVMRAQSGEQDLRAVHLSPDGSLLACGNDDTSLSLWACPAKGPPRLQATTSGFHTDWIHSVFLSRDGRYVATGSDDNSAALFDVAAGKVVGHVRIFSGAFSVLLTPDSSWMFTASGDIRVWSVPKMITAHLATSTPEAAAERHSCEVSGLDVSADGLFAASVSKRCGPDGKCVGLEILSWSCETGRALGRFEVPVSPEDDDRPLCLCLSPEGKRAAVGADTGKFWVVPLEGKGEPLWVEPQAHEERILCCQWLGRDTFATGSEDGAVREWSLAKRSRLAEVQAHDSGVRCLAFTEDGGRVLTASDYEAPKFTDFRGGRCLFVLKDKRREEASTQTASSVSLSVDERRGVTCSWDQAIRLWDLEHGTLMAVVEHISPWVVKGFGATLAWSASGLCISHTWDRQIQVWDFSEYLAPGPAPSQKDGARSAPFDSEDCIWKLAVCQCDASLVRMATARRWPELGAPTGGRRCLAFSDEEGAVHFFEATGSVGG